MYSLVLPCTMSWRPQNKAAIENDVLVRTDTYSYVLVCTSMYWYVLVHTSMYQYVLVHTSMYEFINVQTSTCQYVQVHTGTYAYIPFLGLDSCLVFSTQHWAIPSQRPTHLNAAESLGYMHHFGPTTGTGIVIVAISTCGPGHSAM